MLPIPGGYVGMIAADPDFRLDDAGGKRCRFTVGPGKKNCQRPAVATLRRGRAGRWGYCAEHLYGRWLEDGQVVGFVLRRVDEREAAAPETFRIGPWTIARNWKGESQPDTWEFVHREYNGPGDGSPGERDTRCGIGRTLAEVLEQIEAIEEEAP
jgi:hypothetical protein